VSRQVSNFPSVTAVSGWGRPAHVLQLLRSAAIIGLDPGKTAPGRVAAFHLPFARLLQHHRPDQAGDGRARPRALPSVASGHRYGQRLSMDRSRKAGARSSIAPHSRATRDEEIPVMPKSCGDPG